MYTNSPDDLLYTSYRVKSMSVLKKNSIKFYSLYLSSESIVCFCFLSGHLSVVQAQDYKQRGTAPSRSRETHPSPPSPPSPSPAHLSSTTLFKGGREREAPSRPTSWEGCGLEALRNALSPLPSSTQQHTGHTGQPRQGKPRASGSCQRRQPGAQPIAL